MFELTFFTKGALTYEDQSAHHFVRKMKSFRSRVTLSEGGRAANAKSLMGVLAMELTPGIRVTVVAEGEDETEAAEAVRSILAPEENSDEKTAEDTSQV